MAAELEFFTLQFRHAQRGISWVKLSHPDPDLGVFDDPNLVSFAGLVAGADSIDEMALLRHGGASRQFARAYAPSTLGSFLRAFTFGHVCQLDAVAARFLSALAARAGLLRNGADSSGRPAAG